MSAELNYFLLFLLFEALFVFAILIVYLLRKLVEQRQLVRQPGSGIKVFRRFLTAELEKYSALQAENTSADESLDLVDGLEDEEAQMRRKYLQLRAQILQNELDALSVRHDSSRYYERLVEGLETIPAFENQILYHTNSANRVDTEISGGMDPLLQSMASEPEAIDMEMLHDLMADQNQTIEVLRQAIIEPDLDDEVRKRIQRAVADLEFQLNELQQMVVGLELENNNLKMKTSNSPSKQSLNFSAALNSPTADDDNPFAKSELKQEVHSVEIESRRMLKKIDKLVSNRDLAQELTDLVERLMNSNRELYTCFSVVQKEAVTKQKITE